VRRALERTGRLTRAVYVERMARMWYSRKYDMSPMPHSLFFYGGWPFLTVRGRMGGSAMTAAAVNALAKAGT